MEGHLEDVTFPVERYVVLLCSVLCFKHTDSLVSANAKSMLKVKSVPITGLNRPRGFQEVKVPTFRDNGTGWG